MHRYGGVAVENDEIIDKVDSWPDIHGMLDFPSRHGIGQKFREEIPPDFFQVGRFFFRKAVKGAGAHVQVDGYDKAPVQGQASDPGKYRVQRGEYWPVRFELPVEALDQVDAVVDDGEEQIFFVVEILVKRAVGNTGIFADVGYRGMMISFSGENLRGRIQDDEPFFIREL